MVEVVGVAVAGLLPLARPPRLPKRILEEEQPAGSVRHRHREGIFLLGEDAEPRLPKRNLKTILTQTMDW